MENQNYLTSTDFARAIGITVSTLSRWEEKGLVKPFMITPTGRRKYTWEQVEEYYERCRERSDSEDMSSSFNQQTKIVIKGLTEMEGYSQEEAMKLWQNSETRRLIQDVHKFAHISGARCFDELLMELNKHPFWMKGSFD